MTFFDFIPLFRKIRNKPKSSSNIAINRLEILINQDRIEQNVGFEKELPKFKYEFIQLLQKYFSIKSEYLDNLNVKIKKNLSEEGVPCLEISTELPNE